jgi:crotonobetainyl-CoA:carnitine CoA-transferase CaiB-like acyl-CoA transferase
VSRARTAVYAALLALGCALAAAGSSTGGFLEPDRQVAPFRIRRRPRIVDDPAAGGEDSVTARVARTLDIVFQVLVVVLLAAVVLWGLYRLVTTLLRLYRMRVRKAPAGPGAEEYDTGEESDEDAERTLRRRVAEELRLLSADLDTEVEPREAVIACYVRMEAALASSGAPRGATETPLELLRRVLDAYDVPAADVHRLTELFTEARFSHHPVTDEMRAAARRSLAAVADALAVRA